MKGWFLVAEAGRSGGAGLPLRLVVLFGNVLTFVVQYIEMNILIIKDEGMVWAISLLRALV